MLIFLVIFAESKPPIHANINRDPHWLAEMMYTIIEISAWTYNYDCLSIQGCDVII